MRRLRVLVADSDERLQSRYRALLADDFDLVTARNGLECIARLREWLPDVLVLEPQLPLGDGESVLATMHASPMLATIPVMILTACRNRVILESVAPYRISDYRVKPLDPAQLATRIRHVLDQHRRPLPVAQPEFEDPCKVWRTETAAAGH